MPIHSINISPCLLHPQQCLSASRRMHIAPSHPGTPGHSSCRGKQRQAQTSGETVMPPASTETGTRKPPSLGKQPQLAKANKHERRSANKQPLAVWAACSTAGQNQPCSGRNTPCSGRWEPRRIYPRHSPGPGAGGRATSAARPHSCGRAAPCSQLALRPATAGENSATPAPKAPPPFKRL